jgi:hypothetical protein
MIRQPKSPSFVLVPKPEEVRWDMEPPTKPDANGNDPLPMPGLTQLTI